MSLVHLSDLHLGYRQYQRLTPAGINQREADVAGTFRTCVDRIIAIAPDVVVVAGDIFHTVRPSNQAILHAFVQFSRLVRSLPGAEIVLVAGNHDSPRSTETGGILPLLAQVGVHVVDHEPRRLSFPDRDLSMLRDSRRRRALIFPRLDARSNVPFQCVAVPWRSTRRVTGRVDARRPTRHRDLASGPSRVAMGLRGDGTLPRVSRSRTERVLQWLDRLHESERVGRLVRRTPRRVGREGIRRAQSRHRRTDIS